MQRYRGGRDSIEPAKGNGEPRKEVARFMIDPEDKLIGQTVVGRYDILSKLGVGGMGAVYLAFDRELDRTVAFKVIDDKLMTRADMVERFIREAKAVARITHPNVVQVLDMAHFGEKIYMSMEFLEGVDLAQVLRPRKDKPKTALSWERTKPIMIQTCEALAAAHDQSILHRDLKPANIFITKRDGKDFVKLLDFGLAKSTEGEDTQLTHTGYFLGTLSYGSPEQAMGKKNFDHRADIYSLGVVMFELLTGKLPFKGETDMETLQKHINEPPPKPTSLNPSIPLEVEEVILRALAKKPAERFQTIREMRDAIVRSHTDNSAEFENISDEFMKEAFGDSDAERSAPSVSGRVITEEPEEQHEDNDGDAVGNYMKKKKESSSIGGILKVGIAFSIIGGLALAGYEYRDKIIRGYNEYAHTSPAPSAQNPAPSGSVTARIETGRHVDVTITPSGLTVFVAMNSTTNGRFLGMTPLHNIRLEDGENELVIWRNGRSRMVVRLSPGQTVVSGPFQSGGVNRNRPSNQSPAGTAAPDEVPVQDTAPTEQE